MEINILEEKKDFIKFELKGEDHTLCNALKNALWKNEDVEYATYDVKHPLIGIPTIIVKTKKGNPKDAVLKAISDLKKQNAKVSEGIKGLK